MHTTRNRRTAQPIKPVTLNKSKKRPVTKPPKMFSGGSAPFMFQPPMPSTKSPIRAKREPGQRPGLTIDLAAIAAPLQRSKVEQTDITAPRQTKRASKKSTKPGKGKTKRSKASSVSAKQVTPLAAEQAPGASPSHEGSPATAPLPRNRSLAQFRGDGLAEQITGWLLDRSRKLAALFQPDKRPAIRQARGPARSEPDELAKLRAENARLKQQLADLQNRRS